MHLLHSFDREQEGDEFWKSHDGEQPTLEKGITPRCLAEAGKHLSGSKGSRAGTKDIGTAIVAIYPSPAFHTLSWS